MFIKRTINTIASEVSEGLHRVKTEEGINLAGELQKANRIFVADTGRSGFIGKIFSMRMICC
ncbi:MAG: hypothetical protein ACQEWU_20170 [Bacillota bacterium]|uniref:hypothetical protein n=1 Tax=Virgibacillus TaxID=84406 RepID=UPI0003F50698|nr:MULTISPECIES: hypothetical protein [Bacillaceae]MCC2252480.1 hypothetical protein [Virgibacillus sp. AGTR]WBX81689.1 hypothetical protein PD280_08395 [Virgibacillus salarius]